MATSNRSDAPVIDDISVVEHLGAEPGRLRGWRGSIAVLVVLLALTAVGVALMVTFRVVHSDQPAATTSSSAAPTPTPSPTATPTPSPAAPVAPAATEAAPPPQPTQARPTNVAGSATVGAVTVAFNVADINLRAGKAVGITVNVTGPPTDKINGVVIKNAENVVLASASVATPCTGPALPWTSSYSITFKQAESTEVRVVATTCAGVVVTAASPADVQP